MLYTLAGGGTICGVAALVLLIVTTATDFWMQYRYAGSWAHQGLWRFCINHKCHGHTITVAFWDATRAFMLLSVLSCLAGVVLGLSAFTNGTKNRRVRTGGIALILSAFLALLALAIYTGVMVTFFGKRFLNWRFSWSYIIGWVAIILAFVAGVFQLCAYRRTTMEPAPSNTIES
ncbi:lens intrinsic membrane protein 2.2 [Periophthalmus magnuspinnatus]|uniref:lens intrinsic membrane protein 2.2 n=1 Tax=Periophthalmus magnuspinnatus TaxID=409849 RepID=UPI00145BC115|nr:lens intrinsic membrane protein 2.2 [Periophthalmus magnuspinnatus]